MKWIKYQVIQCEVGDETILLDKRVGYSDANLVIAQNEAYQGAYTIEEDDTTFDDEPLAIKLGGTGGKTADEARENIGAIGVGTNVTSNEEAANLAPGFNSYVSWDTNFIEGNDDTKVIGIATFPAGYHRRQVMFLDMAEGGPAMMTRTIDVEGGNIASEWEWIDPPMMEANKEYRTTKRYKGKPVYCGLMTAKIFNKKGDSSSMTNSFRNIEEIIRFEAIAIPTGSDGTPLKRRYHYPLIASDGTIAESAYAYLNGTCAGFKLVGYKEFGYEGTVNVFIEYVKLS